LHHNTTRLELLALFNAHYVEYLIVGGYALAFHYEQSQRLPCSSLKRHKSSTMSGKLISL
jgi:hypothetical protein